MKLKYIRLKARRWVDMREFYLRTLGFPMVREFDSSITLKAGETLLNFSQTKEKDDSLYHFAFNIPSNQIEAGLAWLKSKQIHLLLDRDTGEEVVHFENWNAHSVFFRDPDGNILELIARHDLNSASERPFSVSSIQQVSEIGLPVPDLKSAYETLHEACGIEPWRGDESRFYAAGDQTGLFIMVPEGREWFPTRTPAVLSSLEIEFEEKGQLWHVNLDKGKLEISGK